MIEHIVLVKFNPDVTQEQKEDIATRLVALKEVIPGILDIQAGHNFSDRSQGFEFGLTVRFASKADLDTYGPHPKHQEVVARMQQYGVASLLAFDFEIA